MPHSSEIYFHTSHSEDTHRLPVVLLHGAGGNHLSWPSEVRRLPGFRIYAPDLPGHGKSGGSGLQSVAAYAQAVLSWMESLGLHQAAFVGHSMGAAIALQIAHDAPQQALALGLLGAAARLRVAPLLLEYAAGSTTFLKAVETVVAWSFGPDTPPALATQAAHRLAEARPAVLYGDFVACSEFDLSDELAAIHAPALVLVGAEDRMTPVRLAQHLSDNLPAARLEILPRLGHMTMLEAPAAVAALLGEVLGRISYP